VRIAVVGGGWAGCAAAFYAHRAGHDVQLFEASKTWGGRARKLQVGDLTLDNGQHILIGAYSACLQLLNDLGVNESDVLYRMPLTLRWPDGRGMQAAQTPFASMNMAWAILSAKGWSIADKLSLIRRSLVWRFNGFQCKTQQTVAQVCQGISPRVMLTLIEPLCVSALNTPARRASGQVFLRVLKDALFAGAGSSDYLIPKCNLSDLIPNRVACVLGDKARAAVRVSTLVRTQSSWTLNDAAGNALGEFDEVVLATPNTEAARLVEHINPQWAASAQSLPQEAIATVYAHCADSAQASALFANAPMLALDSDEQRPAQFAFWREAVTGEKGVLSLVISASNGSAEDLEAKAITQAQAQLGLKLAALKTIVEKRATFACTPALLRPATHIAPGLRAAADYVAGPYPATLEQAVRNAMA
jgi:squalene-associated FAD-dependent desaturase